MSDSRPVGSSTLKIRDTLEGRSVTASFKKGGARRERVDLTKRGRCKVHSKQVIGGVRREGKTAGSARFFFF